MDFLEASATSGKPANFMKKGWLPDTQSFRYGEHPLHLYQQKPLAHSWRPLFILVALLCSLGLLNWKAVLFVLRADTTGHISISSRNPAYLIEALHGAVASENERCSIMGISILKNGGNAIDAAVAAAFCVGVVNMFSSGIGGGGFATVRIPPILPNNISEVYTIDFRETAPALANRTMYRDDPLSAVIGGLSVAVPSEVRGLAEMHRRWGNLSWSTVMQPSVELAKGWTVDRELGRRIPWFGDLMLNNPDWKAIFAPRGVLLREGEIMRRANYSRTLATIASQGPNAFYEGPIADSIIRKIQSTGGIMTHSDLRAFQVKTDRALEGTYRGRKVYTSHAPTSGPALLLMLNLMEKFDNASLEEGRTSLNVHRSVEAMKFGFAARWTKICDPDFGNNTERIAKLTTKSFAELIFHNMTDDRTHPSEYYQPEYDVEVDHGTSHTSVLDKDGIAVSLTLTINLIFGSQVLDPETGIILNDEMDDFSIPGIPNAFGLYPSPYNYPEPFKRPLSSIVPTVMEHPDGSFYLAVGASGGSRIFPSIFQTMLNLDWGLDLSQAVEFGRLHDQLYPMLVDVDDVYPDDILCALRQKGHNVTVQDVNRVAAVVQAVMQKDGKIFATSDSRKNGIAAGY